MSLVNAVTAIADAMQETANTYDDGQYDQRDFKRVLLGYTAQLRAICIACGDQEEQLKAILAAMQSTRNTGNLPMLQGMGGQLLTPQEQHRMEIEKAREKLREERDRSSIHEKTGGGAHLIEVIGGPAAEGNTPTFIDAGGEKPPEGAFTVISGGKYQVRNGKLQFIPE